MKLEEIREELKGILLMKAHSEVMEEEHDKILRNKCAKVGINYPPPRGMDEPTIELFCELEEKTEQKIKAKFGNTTYEVTHTIHRKMRKFNDMALEFAIKNLANKKQKEELKPLQNMTQTEKIIQSDKLFNILSRLDLFCENLNTKEVTHALDKWSKKNDTKN